jgi:hypothetical protein
MTTILVNALAIVLPLATFGTAQTYYSAPTPTCAGSGLR